MLNNLNITMAQWTNNFIVPMAISAVVIVAYVILCTRFLKNADENKKLIPVRVVFFILIALEIAKIFYLIGRDGNFYPNRELDAVNGVGKALYYLQAGFSFALVILFLRGQGWSIRPLNIAWACLAVLVYAGIDALTIWYWEWNIAFDWVWYLTYAISLVTVAAVYGVVLLLRRAMLKKTSSDPQ